MTSAAATLSAPAAAAKDDGLASRAVEALMVGGGTLLLFPIAWIWRSALGLDMAEYQVSFVFFYAAYAINDPHFSVTYLLFYRDMRRRSFDRAIPATQRARYLLAGFVAPVALVAWCAAAITSRSAHSMGLMVQLMYLLVGWHYAKQAFGVLMTLSARRGFRFGLLERRVLLAHCYLAWAFAWSSPFDPGSPFEEKGVVYTSVGHPHFLATATAVVFALSSVALVAVLVRMWLRERRLPPLVPFGAFLITVWLWTVYSAIDPLVAYGIPALHSIQYLYFVWLLKKNEARSQEGPPAFGRPTAMRLGLLAASALGLGWVLFHGAPAALDSAFARGGLGALGPTPYFAAVFTFVNIHHYFMDSVIWRRENAETRFLVA